MKVTKLHIDDYKVFKDFDIDFTNKDGNAQNLIVLAGINGTGKSTLLEFINESVERKSKKSLTKDESYIELLYSLKFERNIMGDDQILHVDSFKQGNLKDWVLNDLVKRVQLFTIDDMMFDDVSEIVVRYVDQCIYEKNMRASQAYDSLRDFLSSILPNFDLGVQFDSLTADREPIFRNKKFGKILFDALSTGERQILGFVFNIILKSLVDKVILIDEPEFSLHPSWQNKIVGVLQKYADEYNCQVILATHSPQIIGSVHPEQLRVLYKNEQGNIKAKEYIRESYGLPFDRVLTEIMGVEQLRTPVVDDAINELRDLLSDNQYESSDFIEKMKRMEDTIGFSDKDLILMRFEIAKRKKERAANH
ncbi:MAG: hypothetical protein JWO03_2013 [Bacteroidetes bacterium]|nr:hypothetical protein [Bacteroidota bacterium]